VAKFASLALGAALCACFQVVETAKWLVLTTKLLCLENKTADHSVAEFVVSRIDEWQAWLELD